MLLLVLAYYKQSCCKYSWIGFCVNTSFHSLGWISRDNWWIVGNCMFSFIGNSKSSSSLPKPSLGWEDSLEKGTAAHSSILGWRLPWAEEPGWAIVHGVAESLYLKYKQPSLYFHQQYVKKSTDPCPWQFFNFFSFSWRFTFPEAISNMPLDLSFL